MCKIMEKIVCNALVYHLDFNNVIIDNQHGFRHKRSCETQLLQSVNDWQEALDNGYNIDVIYLDISRAFDTVSHCLLFNKLRT